MKEHLRVPGIMHCYSGGFEAMQEFLNMGMYLSLIHIFYLHTAKIVMKTVYDLLSCPQLQVKNKDFSERKEFYLKNWLYKEQE